MSAEPGPEFDDTDHSFRRRTGTCPACRGIVREMRMGEQWLCDDCARHLDESEVLETDGRDVSVDGGGCDAE